MQARTPTLASLVFPGLLAASALPPKCNHSRLTLDKNAEEFIPQSQRCHTDMSDACEECDTDARSRLYIPHLEALVSTRSETIAILMRQETAVHLRVDVAATCELPLACFGADPCAQFQPALRWCER